MKGSYFIGNKQFEVHDLVLPHLGSNDVLIRNKVAGICGTDVHIYHGGKGSADVTPPVVLGHEYAGIVEQTGENVTNIKTGDYVTVDPNIYCGECFFCRRGQKQFCSNLQAIGVTRNGGFAEYSVVPSTQVFAFSGDVSFEEMAMAEPLACCIHGIEQVNIVSGDLVVVVGGGAIGLIMVQLAKLRGAGKVILSEPVEYRRKVALDLGADVVVDPTTVDVCEQIHSLTGRNGADVVIECVGIASVTKQAISMADRGGRILLFSVPTPEATIDLPLIDVFHKELKIYGSFINPNTHQSAVDLINSKRIQVAPLITHRFSLNQLDEAIHMQTSIDSIKVQIIPDKE